jgi:hypothetical protein
MKSKIRLIALLTIFLSSCESSDDKMCEAYSKYQYILITTHDSNWTHSARIFCDSVKMNSQQEVDAYVDGRIMPMKAPQFRVFNNPKHKKQ